ncbi:hypothetical protein MMC12_007941 [Toensbergia leucococca]|nr:hypothetical protein [Toensbergia leucococca]
MLALILLIGCCYLTIAYSSPTITSPGQQDVYDQASEVEYFAEPADSKHSAKSLSSSAENNFTLMHYHRSATNFKRGMTFIHKTCPGLPGGPEGFYFIKSFCLRGKSAMSDVSFEMSLNYQAYRIQCHRGTVVLPDESVVPPETRYIDGSCLPNELCVDGPLMDFNLHWQGDVASCVATDNYHKIAATLLGAIGRIQIPEDRPSGSQVLLADAVLTGPTIDTAAQAEFITISALTQVSAIHNIPQYGQLPGGAWHCTECFNLGPVSLPEATDSLAASAKMASGTAGILYLTTFLSG